MTRGLLLVVVTVLVYARALDAPFTYDDRVEVIGNPTLRTLGEWGAIAGYHPSRPLLILSYALNWAWGGFEPLGYHVVSVTIHALNALLAWRLATRLVDADRALVAAALWALHPMCTEAVTYVTGRSDALSGTFWLAALITWVDHRRGHHGPWLTWAATVGAMLTKEMGVLLPFVLLAFSRFALGDRPPPRSWAPPLVVALAAGTVRLAAWGWPIAEVDRGAWAQLTSQAEAWTVYLRLWLVPIGQSILHDHPGEARFLGIAALAAWGFFAGWIVRRGGLPTACLALAAAYVLPASLVPLKEVLAEHRSYLAGYALCLAIVSVTPWSRGWWAAVGLLGAATVARNEVWRDAARVWRGAVDTNPASADAWYGYGDALRFAQRFPEAEVAFREVLARRPHDVDAHVNLGIVVVQQGREAEARATWEAALKLDPRACAAHNDLAALDLRAGRLPAAATGYTSTLYWCPDDRIALRALGGIYEEMGDYRRAAEMLRRYLEIAPPGTEREDAAEVLRRMSP